MRVYYKIVYIILLLSLWLIIPQSLMAQKPSKAASMCAKAQQLINSQQFDKALVLLNQAKAKDPSYSDIYIMMGDIYNFTLKSDSAFRCYTKAIELIGEPDP